MTEIAKRNTVENAGKKRKSTLLNTEAREKSIVAEMIAKKVAAEAVIDLVVITEVIEKRVIVVVLTPNLSHLKTEAVVHHYHQQIQDLPKPRTQTVHQNNSHKSPHK